MKIRYLHLSDLHLTDIENKGAVEAFNRDIVTHSLVKTIKASDLHIDFIIITGDIAFSGKPAEYYEVCQVFDAMRCNSHELGLGGTTPAGIFPEGASPYGVLDMAGNVWEWCQDWYGDYSSETAVDPTGTAHGWCRVLRGGSWYNLAESCGTKERCYFYPDDRSDCRGFRLVLLPCQK